MGEPYADRRKVLIGLLHCVRQICLQSRSEVNNVAALQSAGRKSLPAGSFKPLLFRQIKIDDIRPRLYGRGQLSLLTILARDQFWHSYRIGFITRKNSRTDNNLVLTRQTSPRVVGEHQFVLPSIIRDAARGASRIRIKDNFRFWQRLAIECDRARYQSSCGT